jgi:hypothetical protein
LRNEQAVLPQCFNLTQAQRRWLQLVRPGGNSMVAITLNSRWHSQSRFVRDCHPPSRSTGAPMTAVIYNFERVRESDSTDETERLLSALGRYTSAELLELLYVGEEPGFFELMRGLFGLSEESRSVLQDFLAALHTQRTTVTIDQEGRCVLAREAAPPRGIPA